MLGGFGNEFIFENSFEESSVIPESQESGWVLQGQCYVLYLLYLLMKLNHIYN